MYKGKKILSVGLVFMLIMVCLVACNNAKETTNEEAAWTITVEGAKDNGVSFTNIDGDKIGVKEITATMKKKDGSEKEQQWKGYSLKEVLASYEVTDFSTVVVEASDGYSKEYTPDLVNSEGTILGIMVDGEKLPDDNKVQLVVNGKGSNWWIKDVAKIIVNK